MNVGDTARITHGPWRGHTGPVLATFTGGWVTVRVANMERTFPTHELNVVDAHRTVTSEGGKRFACLDCPATSRNRPPTGPCTGDTT